MIEVKNKVDCCGCAACSQACNKNAILMQQDKKGFSYPVVDKDLCVNCGLCEKVCPIHNENPERVPEHVYGVKNKDENIRRDSSSGGLFTIFAEDVIDKGGVVYGAAFDCDWSVHHVRITNKLEIAKLRGSKYVQSNIGNTYIEAKKDLIEGKNVLYSGTPCQIAGLLKFLHKKYDNLTTIDFVCHGVPNPRIWKDYLIEEISARRAVAGKSTDFSSLNTMSLIKDIKFRDKSNGWKKYRFFLRFAEASAEGKKSSDFSSYSTYVWEHPYMLLFLNDYILRPSCHECHFRCGKSHAIYTIADYWCIERKHPDFFDDNGVSMLLQYDNKNISHILKHTEYIETPFEEACYGNVCIRRSWPRKRTATLFYVIHDKLGLDFKRSLSICLAADKLIYRMTSLKARLRYKIKSCLS